MKQWIKIGAVVIVLCASSAGCGFLSRSGSEPFAATSATDLVDKGKVIDKQSLTSGGTLLVLPFKAGQGIPANAELDKIALKMIRGLLDAFEASEASVPLKVAFNEDQAKADFILVGYITRMEQPSWFKRWVLRDPKRILHIEGEITRRDKVKPVMVFTDKVEKDANDLSALGLIAGRHIGNFIVDATASGR